MCAHKQEQTKIEDGHRWSDDSSFLVATHRWQLASWLLAHAVMMQATIHSIMMQATIMMETTTASLPPGHILKLRRRPEGAMCTRALARKHTHDDGSYGGDRRERCLLLHSRHRVTFFSSAFPSHFSSVSSVPTLCTGFTGWELGRGTGGQEDRRPGGRE